MRKEVFMPKALLVRTSNIFISLHALLMSANIVLELLAI